MINGTPVRDQVAYSLPFTLDLTLVALLIGIVLGVPAGVWTAIQRNRVSDYVARIVSLASVSVPAFFLCILLILLFGVQLRWLPAIGGGNANSPADLVTYVILPALTLGLVMVASVTRLTRAAMLNTLSQEYVRTARAKGLHQESDYGAAYHAQPTRRNGGAGQRVDRLSHLHRGEPEFHWSGCFAPDALAILISVLASISWAMACAMFWTQPPNAESQTAENFGDGTCQVHSPETPG
jgi:Binding-protein-dependent transport system inner membrane component